VKEVVLSADQGDTTRRQAISTGAASLLIIGLQRAGQLIMDHNADVALVHVHAKRVRGHHDSYTS